MSVKCEPMHPDAEGWTEWIHPLPGYLMQCCDCGLIHEMQFMIVTPCEDNDPATLNQGEDAQRVIIFRARRYDPDYEKRKAALSEMVRIDEELGLYEDTEPLSPADLDWSNWP